MCFPPGVVLALYCGGKYSEIASDDKRFIKKPQLLGISCITPTVLILLLVRDGHIGADGGFARLDALSSMVSDAETAMAETKLETLRKEGDLDADDVLQSFRQFDL